MTSSKVLKGEHYEFAVVRPEALGMTDEDLHSAEERTLRAAWDKGYAEGNEQGRIESEREAAAARESTALALLALAEATTQVNAAFERERGRLERDAVELAFALTEALLARELELSKSPGTEAVQRALADISSDAAVTVHLNPADVESIDDVPRQGDAQRIVADTAVERGSCLLEVGSAVVDARLDTALARVRRVFDEVVA